MGHVAAGTNAGGVEGGPASGRHVGELGEGSRVETFSAVIEPGGKTAEGGGGGRREPAGAEVSALSHAKWASILGFTCFSESFPHRD